MKKILNRLFDKKHRARTISFTVVTLAYIVICVLKSTVGLKSLFSSLLVPTCCYITVALALNLVVGISGELSLGHAGFMSLGAFTAVVVSGLLEATITSGILRLIIAMLAGGIVAAICGFLISVPVLKLEGDYLAIVTLAFGQIIKSLINVIYLGFDKNGVQVAFFNNTLTLGEGKKMLISGPMGATATTRISTFTVGFALILFTLFLIYNLMDSKHGRAIMAARDNRIAAQSVGINITQTKMLAFVVSAALAGMAGSLYALNYSSVTPAKFDFNASILILVYVVLGGLGNMTGTIISTMILFILPELLRFLQDYRMLIYAIVLIAIMLVTNNETLKGKTSQIKNRFKPAKKGEVNYD